MIAILKAPQKTSWNNMELDIGGLTHLSVNNTFNLIIGYLDINSLRTKIDNFREVFKKFKLIFFV